MIEKKQETKRKLYYEYHSECAGIFRKYPMLLQHVYEAQNNLDEFRQKINIVFGITFSDDKISAIYDDRTSENDFLQNLQTSICARYAREQVKKHTK